MDLEETKHGDVVVLGPKGSLNTETSPKLEQKVVQLLGASERWFVIDFTSVEYISSAGLRVLLMMTKRLRAMGGAMVLCSMSKDVAKVFALCGFERDFTMVAARAEALERLFTGTAAPAAAAPVKAAPAPAPTAAAPDDPPADVPPAAEAPDAARADELRRALSTGLAPATPSGDGGAPPDLVEQARRALSA